MSRGITHFTFLSFSRIVCEEVCHQGNLFDDGKCLVSKKTVEELKEAAKTPKVIAELEERVKIWCKKLAEVLKESEQIRKENDSSGTYYNITQIFNNVITSTTVCSKIFTGVYSQF